MAQVDYFLKVKGADGESADSKHAKEIELETWSVGGVNSGSFSSATSGAGVGRALIGDFHFTKKVDAASPKLFLHCCTGEHIGEITLTCRKAGKDQQEFLTITLTNAIVSAYQLGESHDDEDVLPMDKGAFAFGKIKVEYKPQKPDGTLGAAIDVTWDITQNSAS